MKDVSLFISMLAKSDVCFQRTAIEGGGSSVTILATTCSFKFDRDGNFLTIVQRS